MPQLNDEEREILEAFEQGMMVQNDTSLEINTLTWRRQLLARLAAERVGLWRQLHGIDEAALSTFFIDGEWTAKDILAHIGGWDAFHTERMSMVLHGRINAIRQLGGPDAIDARNAELHTFCRDLSLEQALAVCLKERGGFLAALARIPDELLHREIELPWGWRTYMREWAEWRYQHDAAHAGQLREWRKELPQTQKRQIGPIFLLRATLKATRKAFRALADLIPAGERESRPVCGRWSLKDVAGHLTDWERVGVTGLRQLAAGQSPEFDEAIDDFDVWNNARAAARQDQPWEAVWAEFHETRDELLMLADKMTDAGWRQSFTAPWGSQVNGYIWITIWSGHEHEHAQDLRLAVGGW